jgi:hypothetical protein
MLLNILVTFPVSAEAVSKTDKRVPARPWSWALRAAADIGSCPRAMAAPMMPDKTSPDPAVASALVPALTIRRCPRGDAMTVVGPFNKMTHPEA